MSAAACRWLHLGLGAFHRAHQAVYLHRLHELGDTSWQLASGNIRPDGDDLVRALQAQGGAYTLQTIAPDGTESFELIRSIGEVVPWTADLRRLVELGADPQTRIVSFTVTEAGYYLRPDDTLDARHPDITHDLAQLRSPSPTVRTIHGALALMLRERMQREGGTLTLLCCDNLRHNGRRSRDGLLEFLALAGEAALLAWVRRETRSPNTMVDRITPRPTAAVVQQVQRATGRHDPAALMAESYLQWVVEKSFAGERPAWERVGVEMTSDVQPHEEAKIRLLNATHSCIAWAGTLLGHRFIHEGAQDPRVRQLAFDYVTHDAIPALEDSPIDLAAYRDMVLARFANPAILDTMERVFTDSFAKLPTFIVPTIRERLAAGADIQAVAMLPALYLRCLQSWHAGVLPFAYEDQALPAGLGHAICEHADALAAFAAQEAVWGDLTGDAELVHALRSAYQRIDAALA